MFTISVKTHFEASHQLTLPDGSKETLHKHNWMVTTVVSSTKLNSMGLVIDFHRLKTMVDNIVSDFAGASIKKIGYFRKNNPSAENVAKYIYRKLSPQLPRNVKLMCISVTEEPGCKAKFSE